MTSMKRKTTKVDISLADISNNSTEISVPKKERDKSVSITSHLSRKLTLLKTGDRKSVSGKRESLRSLNSEELRNAFPFKDDEEEERQRSKRNKLEYKGKKAYFNEHEVNQNKFEKKKDLQNVRISIALPSELGNELSEKLKSQEKVSPKNEFMIVGEDYLQPFKKTESTESLSEKVYKQQQPSMERKSEIINTLFSSSEKEYFSCHKCRTDNIKIDLTDEYVEEESAEHESFVEIEEEIVDENDPENRSLFKQKIHLSSLLGRPNLKRYRIPTLTKFEEVFSMTPDTFQSEMFLINFVHIAPNVDLYNLMDRLHNEGMNLEGFLLKWRFLNADDELFFKVNRNSSNSCYINAYRRYNFNLNKDYYLYFKKCDLCMDLYAKIAEERDKYLGQCVVPIRKALEEPNVSKESFADVTNEIIWRLNNVKQEDFCCIQCRYLFKGKKTAFTQCKPDPVPLIMVEEAPEETMEFLYGDQIVDFPSLSLSETTEFRDGLDLILLRYRSLNFDQDIISSELKDRTTWIHRELQWKLTLEKNCILTGKNPNLVRWRQFRDERVSLIKFRPLTEDDSILKDVEEIEISVIELMLRKKSPIILDTKIIYLYMEIIFLNFSGRSVESDRAVKTFDADEPIIFNFTRVFRIELSDAKAKLLAQHVEENESIVFSLISEPFGAEENFVYSAVEIGRGVLPYHELVQGFDDICKTEIAMYDDDEAILGHLKVQIVGVLKIRAIALKLLSAKYKLPE